MITCPNCKQTLPPSALTCQFCGADVRSVKRPRFERDRISGASNAAGAGLTPEHIVQVWIALGALWVLTIIWGFVFGLSIIPARFGGQLSGGLISGVVVIVQILRLGGAVTFTGRMKVPLTAINGAVWLGVGWCVLGLVLNGINIATAGSSGIGYVVMDVACLLVHSGVFWIIKRAEEDGLLP
ncbi:MAG: hypothetical protein JSS65_08750 [Armatimonadetes bacterium]|nr:hypothetical protein [Armatimonadota bacterium]